MLPARHRLTDSDLFRVAVRSGCRNGRRTLVVHLYVNPAPQSSSTDDSARVGLVVSRAVGNAVVRNRVKRRLRHLSRHLVDDLVALPGPTIMVVRALPAAGTASSAQLRSDLMQVFDGCVRKLGQRSAVGA